MKKYKSFLLAALMFGTMCAYALAGDSGLNAESVKISTTVVQDINAFDIHEELAAIKQAKADRDNAIKNSDGSKQKIEDTLIKYEDVKTKLLEKIKERRRDQHLVGFEVTRHGYAFAWRYDWGDDFARPSYEGDYRIDCPNPAEWVLIPGSGHCNVHKISQQIKTGICTNKKTGKQSTYETVGAEINKHREENNGYIVHVRVKGTYGIGGAYKGSKPPKRKLEEFVDFTLVARYRYNDAIINRMLDSDMNSIRARIDAELK